MHHAFHTACVGAHACSRRETGKRAQVDAPLLYIQVCALGESYDNLVCQCVTCQISGHTNFRYPNRNSEYFGCEMSESAKLRPSYLTVREYSVKSFIGLMWDQQPHGPRGSGSGKHVIVIDAVIKHMNKIAPYAHAKVPRCFTQPTRLIDRADIGLGRCPSHPFPRFPRPVAHLQQIIVL